MHADEFSPLTTREAAVAAIRETMPADLQERIIALLRPAIRIRAAVTEDARIPLGASKFGGAPDMPPGSTWPAFETDPLVFIAQFDLAELKHFESSLALPQEGLLSFFFTPDYLGEPGALHTLWLNAPRYERLPVPEQFRPKPQPEPRGWWAKLKARANPWHFAPPVPPCQLSFQTSWQLPEMESPFLNLELGTALKAYDDLWVRMYGEHTTHQLGGYAQSVQNDVHLSVAQTENKLDWKRDAERIKQEAHTWQLLFQHDSQGNDWMWGDVGKLYFLIQEQDLRARMFDKVAAEFQCC